ncbi:MAG: hypothetical protein NXI10_07550 [bacterium]|nr:hypothetical protein [bacterium]
MKKTRFILAALPVVLVTLVLSCSEEAPKVRIEKGDDEKKEMGAELPNVKADRLLVVDLEGMVCEMGCGGTIRKELYASNAVKEVSFDFDEERTVDVAKVAFDRNKISADKIVAIIAAANKGQFTVINTRSEPYLDTASDKQEETSSLEEPKKEKRAVAIKTSSHSSLSSGFFDLFSWF